MFGFRKFAGAAFLALTLLPLASASGVKAAPPLPFMAHYNASYGEFSAAASRTLSVDEATGNFELESRISLTMLGATLTSITERSEFRWENEQPLPLDYEYVQEGIGGRSRSVQFDHEAGIAAFKVNDTSGTLPMNGAVFDDLSSYLLLRDQLAKGATDIYFKVVDRDRIEVYHYLVQGEEVLSTALGEFRTVRLVRIRDDNSARHTQIWLAPEHDYLLVKLVHEEPDSRTISLDIREATIDGKVIKARGLASG